MGHLNSQTRGFPNISFSSLQAESLESVDTSRGYFYYRNLSVENIFPCPSFFVYQRRLNFDQDLTRFLSSPIFFFLN